MSLSSTIEAFDLPGKVREEVRAALAAASEDGIPPQERAEMLMEIAMGLQQRPETPEQLGQAIHLYEHGVTLAAEHGDSLLAARIKARLGTALLAMPSQDAGITQQAFECFEESAAVLRASGHPDEIAELEMNLGLVLQTLAGMGKAKLTDAISAYQRALRTFNAQKFPKEYAILQNNLATAFLQVPVGSDQRMNIREALAVQAFEQALAVISMVEHPVEYAMLQNNLGNALQYASTTHWLENCLRALEAYDEALKVRREDNMPSAYANTLANKAGCLANIPDDLEQPEKGNAGNLQRAMALYREAGRVFSVCGEYEKAAMVNAAYEELAQDIAEIIAANDNPGSAERRNSL